MDGQDRPTPPLYYLLLHYWIALNGDTPYYVRLLSVLFGAGTIPVIYLIGKRMSGVVMDGGSSAPGFFAFQHLTLPGSAHVHPPDVQCSRSDLCPGQAAYGLTLRQAHRQSISGISACLAHLRAG